MSPKLVSAIYLRFHYRNMAQLDVEQPRLRTALADWRRIPVRIAILVFMVSAAFVLISSSRLGAQGVSWRISPEKIHIQVGDERQLQLLDESAQELHTREWSVDDSAMADIRVEDGRAVVKAKSTGTVRVYATLNGERKFREIKILTDLDVLPPGTTRWGSHPIGREIGDISAVPTPGGPSLFSLEQTANGNTYLRGTRDDGIQIWNWLMPEAHDVDLVCGDWLGGALVSANRSDHTPLHGRQRRQVTLAGHAAWHA